MSTITANIKEPIKKELDKMPHNQSYSEVYNVYIYIIIKGEVKITKKPTQKKKLENK